MFRHSLFAGENTCALFSHEALPVYHEPQVVAFANHLAILLGHNVKKQLAAVNLCQGGRGLHLSLIHI